MTHPVMHRMTSLTALILLGMALTSCSLIESDFQLMPDSSYTMKTEDAQRILEQRIRFEAAEKMYLDFMAQAQRELSALVGDSLVWQGQPEVIDRTSCSPPLHMVREAEKMFVDSGNATAIPDEKWEAAVALVKRLAEQMGYRQVQVHLNRPGDHEVSLLSDEGSSIVFGTAKATTLTLYSPCHLREHPFVPSTPPVTPLPS